MKRVYFIVLLIITILIVGCNNDLTENASKINDEDLSEFFQGYEGSFVLFDSNNNEYNIYNRIKSEEQISPCSTFKIINSLIGLETKVIEDENTTFKWDGKKYSIESWNKDHMLATAISNSVVWYYQKLASKVGKDNMQKYINDVNYGNKDISGGITKFWLQSSLKISPREQVEMLKKFYRNELSFSKRNIDIVKKIIVLSEENDTVLSGKTGGGVVNGKCINGWFIGYVEKNKNVYFFATNIQSQDGATGYKAKELTLQILKEKKIL